MAYPADLKYTKDHEWIRVSGDIAEVGITDFAQQQLGDVVYVELPDVGRTVNAGESFGSIESVKAVSELFAPARGRDHRGQSRAQGSPGVGQHAAARDVDGAAPPVGSERDRIAARRRGVRTSRFSVDAHDRRDRLVCPRHIGPSPDERERMLQTIGAASLDALIDEAIPSSIRLQRPSICRRRRASISTSVVWPTSRVATDRSAPTSVSAITTRSRRASCCGW